MTRYVLRRILWGILLLILVSALTFVLFRILPTAEPARLRAGHDASPKVIAELRVDLGLTKPLITQFWLYMKGLFLHFDLGYSYYSGASVRSLIFNRLPATLSLTIGAMIIWTAGTPPPPPVIRAAEKMGASLAHAYGLTETYGPHTICAWHPEWDALPAAERAQLRARQGVAYTVAGMDLRVVDGEMRDVPADGATMGEVLMRGNNVMLGYYKNPQATEEAFRAGWFHSGDLAVMHPDGYIEVRDRQKDIVISGGENISSIEVEKVLAEHPAVLEAAVVAAPDEKWGEVPKAYI